MQKALFLDRDGVIVKLHYNPNLDLIDTVADPKQIELEFGIVDLIKQAKKSNYLVILISNQSAIAQGKISMTRFKAIQKKLNKTLIDQGASLDAEYYCFHHPFGKIKKYQKDCGCRKPKPGLLLQAAKKHKIDLSKSFFIGDGVSDILAGYNAGIKTILLTNCAEAGYLSVLQEKLGKIKPNYLIKRLSEAEKIIEL